MSRFAHIKLHHGTSEYNKEKALGEKLRQTGTKAGNGEITPERRAEMKAHMASQEKLKVLMKKKI